MQETEKIRILRIISRLNIGGPSIHSLLLSKKLESQFFESHLIFGTSNTLEGTLAPTGAQSFNYYYIPTLQRDISLLKDLRSFISILKIIKKVRPHIVHTHQAKAGLLGRIAALTMGVPIRIHTFHGHVFHSYFSHWKSKFFILLERILARYSHLIAISENQKKELEIYLKHPPSISVIPLGLELKTFQNLPPQGHVKKQWGFPINSVLVGIVGRLAPIKNHDLFLDIAQELKNKCPHVIFLIVGDGERRPYLEKRIQNENLDNIKMLGWQRDLKTIYSLLDIVVLTSLNEGTPVSLIEAAACQKPIVSANVGGVSSIVQHETNGYLVHNHNKSDFINFLEKLIQNKELRETMGKSLQQKIIEYFGEDHLVQDIEGLYKKTGSKYRAKHRGVGGKNILPFI